MLLLHEFTTFYTVTTGKNGGLGPCGYRPCFVCAVHSWLAVSTPWQGPTRGILQLPNQWRFHLRPHTSLLRLYGYLPHCYWSPHQFLTPLCLISRLPIFLYFVFVLYDFYYGRSIFRFLFAHTLYYFGTLLNTLICQLKILSYMFINYVRPLMMRNIKFRSFFKCICTCNTNLWWLLRILKRRFWANNMIKP